MFTNQKSNPWCCTKGDGVNTPPTKQTQDLCLENKKNIFPLSTKIKNNIQQHRIKSWEEIFFVVQRAEGVTGSIYPLLSKHKTTVWSKNQSHFLS